MAANATAIEAFARAMALHGEGNLAGARAAYWETLRTDPTHLAALHFAGLMAHLQGDNDEALELVEKSVRLQPSVAAFWHNLGMVRMARCELERAIACYRRALRLKPEAHDVQTALIFALDHLPGTTYVETAAARRQLDRRFTAPLTAKADSSYPDLDRDPERPLRVGYVSGDFRHHSAVHTFAGFLLVHHPDRVAPVVYSTVGEKQRDPTYQYMVGQMEEWYDASALDDDALYEQIKGDKIDILVDLSGYTNGNRLAVFARSPAPIQVTGWGYMTGTGMDAMDYLMADAVSIPPEHEKFFSERIVRLPACIGYWVPEYMPEIKREDHGPAVTFGILARLVKFSPAFLDAVGTILARVPGSRLLVKDGCFEEPRARDALADALLARGVEEHRVTILGGGSHGVHLETWNEVDIGLVPFPVCGTVSVLEGLYMGVPQVTLLGEKVTERTAAAVMTAVNRRLPDVLIAASPHAYVRYAVDLAEADTQRRWYHGALRQWLQDSILCRHDDYARAVEDAYRQMWRTWLDQTNEHEAAEPRVLQAVG